MMIILIPFVFSIQGFLSKGSMGLSSLFFTKVISYKLTNEKTLKTIIPPFMLDRISILVFPSKRDHTN